MILGPLAASLSLASGMLIGMTLGLIGGGGSILAVPLLVYLVGIRSPHLAIGTSAVAVALNSAMGLAAHAKRGTVKWPCALVFAAAGVAGALLGSMLGKAVDGAALLTLFGVAMIGVGFAMMRSPSAAENSDIRLSRHSAPELLPKLLGVGSGVGLLSGFFGVGGGFLAVPGLVLGSGMALPNAIGTSLVAVTAFGLTTAMSYAFSGLVDWTVAFLLIAGGVAGVLAGTRMAAKLGSRRRTLAGIFAVVVIGVGLYVIVKGLPAFLALV